MRLHRPILGVRRWADQRRGRSHRGGHLGRGDGRLPQSAPHRLPADPRHRRLLHLRRVSPAVRPRHGRRDRGHAAPRRPRRAAGADPRRRIDQPVRTPTGDSPRTWRRSTPPTRVFGATASCPGSIRRPSCSTSTPPRPRPPGRAPTTLGLPRLLVRRDPCRRQHHALRLRFPAGSAQPRVPARRLRRPAGGRLHPPGVLRPPRVSPDSADPEICATITGDAFHYFFGRHDVSGLEITYFSSPAPGTPPARIDFHLHNPGDPEPPWFPLFEHCAKFTYGL